VVSRQTPVRAARDPCPRQFGVVEVRDLRIPVLRTQSRLVVKPSEIVAFRPEKAGSLDPPTLAATGQIGFSPTFIRARFVESIADTIARPRQATAWRFTCKTRTLSNGNKNDASEISMAATSTNLMPSGRAFHLLRIPESMPH
jgi:hypothetical protein